MEEGTEGRPRYTLWHAGEGEDEDVDVVSLLLATIPLTELREPYQSRVRQLGKYQPVIVRDAESADAYQGKGFGSYLYNYVFSLLLEKGELLLPSETAEEGQSSSDARMVWERLEARYPLLRDVLEGFQGDWITEDDGIW